MLEQFYLFLKCFNNSTFFNIVCQLVIKVLNIIDARCNHEVYVRSKLANLKDYPVPLKSEPYLQLFRPTYMTHS